MAYLDKPNRTRWRGAMRAALGPYRTSWRYRIAVSCGPERGIDLARMLMRLNKAVATGMLAVTDTMRALGEALGHCDDAMRSFLAAVDPVKTYTSDHRTDQ